MSGLAYAKEATVARCTTFEKMSFDGVDLEDKSYPCDPTNQQKQCHLHYAIHEDDVGLTLPYDQYV